jgi:putative ABC transport system permease protein
VCTFLIINVVLGLFGITWYHVSRRAEEIGIRIAVGSTRKAVCGQIIGETVVLSTFGIAVGCLIIVQFPLLSLLQNISLSLYALSFGISLIIIYGLTIVSALYPGLRAATVFPAEALRTE